MSYGRAKWLSDEELLSRPSKPKDVGSYPKAELDAMTREADAHNAALAARTPIATALQAEITALLAHEYQIQRFGERFGLLASADRVCFEAQQTGRDVEHDGSGDAVDLAQVMRYAREEM